MEYLTFPWEQLGALPRGLSLSGGIGNAAAWICFLVMGGIPLGMAAALLIRRRACKADFMLPALSVAFYAGLWFLVNPSYLNRYLYPMGLGDFGKYALTAVLALVVLWQGGAGFVAACRELAERNTGASNLVPISCLFLGLQTLAEYLPQILELVLYCMVLDLLRSCEREVFSGESYGKVERLKKYSSLFLGAIVLVNLGVNVLQLLFARFLLSSHYAVVFPLWEIIVVLGIAVLSRFYLESRRLKEDNDMFI